MEEQIIDPWTVESKNGIDYLKLIRHFGCDPIDGKLIKRFEQVTRRKAHTWLRRGLFFSHKDLELCLNDYEKNIPIYLYTGRGPSSESLHLGHLVPFMFTKWLQDVFNAVLIIQMSDDEKFAFKGGDLEYYENLTFENSKDIIACGFNVDKTFIFSNTHSMGGELYKNVVKIENCISGNAIKTIYGLTSDRKIGEIAWACRQSAPAFSSSFADILHPDAKYNLYPDGSRKYEPYVNIRCLVPMAIDQRPYFAMTRDVAERIGGLKPSEIHSEFLPSLGGITTKMSSTHQTPPVFLTDNPKTIQTKIKKSFSGGKDTLELHREHGGDLRTDVAYNYLLYFCEDDKVLEKIAHQYGSGEMLSGEIKKILTDILVDLVIKHQENRSKITDEILTKYFDRYRMFDTRVVHDDGLTKDFVLDTDENYHNMGVNFDRFFGHYKAKDVIV